MRIISPKAINDAKRDHPDCESALTGWLRVIKYNTFLNFADLRDKFNSVDKVGNKYVFNVGGNKLRIITAIHFNTSTVYIRDVLTHKAYDADKWKK